MSSILPTLSTEILELLSTFLPLADLRSFRFVCRAINRKTLHPFALANFTTVQTDLSRSSLQRLRGISEVEQLASRVQCLRIVNPAINGRLGEGFNWSRDQWGNLEDQLEGLVSLKTVLFDKLLKCRSIHIDSYDEYEPRHETDFLLPSQAVGLILSFVAAGLALRSFTISSSHEGSGRLDTKGLQISLSYTPLFIAAWSQIEELRLEYAMTSDQYDWILHLISSAPRLRSLCLGFHDTSSSFMERLGSLPSLNRLEALTIRAAHTTVGSISMLLLQNRKTLRSLSFRRTSVEDGGKWAAVLETIKDQMPKLENLSFFWLKERPSNRRVSFSAMTRYPVVPGSEERRPGDGRLRFDSHKLDSVEEPIRFRYWGARQSVAGVEYHGCGIEHVLSALAEAAETMSL